MVELIDTELFGELETVFSGVVVKLKFVVVVTAGIDGNWVLSINVEFMKILLTGIVVVTLYIVVENIFSVEVWYITVVEFIDAELIDEVETGISEVVVKLKFVVGLTAGIDGNWVLSIDDELIEILLTGIVVVTLYKVVENILSVEVW